MAKDQAGCMSSQPNYFIECRNLHYRVDDREIFSNLNLKIETGKISVILGPSGTGKTTLLKLMCGQLRPSSGQVLVDGQDLAGLSRKELLLLRKRLSLLFQSGALFTDLTVFENVAFPLREHTKLPEHMIRDLVLLRLEAVGLRGTAELMPSALSGGMARRVALARSLALDPEFIMYDEPFTGQDPISMGVLLKLIAQTHENLKLTSVLVSHDVQEALSLADTVFVLNQGKVQVSGTPKQMESHPDAFVQQFLFGKGAEAESFHYSAESLQQQVLND